VHAESCDNARLFLTAPVAATMPSKPAQSRSSSRTPSHKSSKSSRSTKKGSKASPRRSSAAKAAAPARPYVVRRSAIHGRGVFAARTIRKGTDIIEYRGQRITMKEADRRPDSDPDNPYHTFLFELDDGRVIDADVRGNAARWINHSCAPNCEPYEDDEGRVFIAAKRTIRKGEELGYDYRLNVDGRITKAMREAYACRCGAPRCRGTMLGKKR
jgi:SET domain-containing protein